MDEKVLKALGDPTRFKLLQLMREEGCCVKALAHRCSLSEPAVSQHLKLLREADLVTGIRYGYYTHYSINKDVLNEAIRELSQLTESPKKQCTGTFRGCSVAQEVGCKNYGQKEGTTEKC